MANEHALPEWARDELNVIAAQRHEAGKPLIIYVLERSSSGACDKIARNIAEDLADEDGPKTLSDDPGRDEVIFAHMPDALTRSIKREAMDEWRELEEATSMARAMKWDFVICSKSISAQAHRTLNVLIDARDGTFRGMYRRRTGPARGTSLKRVVI